MIFLQTTKVFVTKKIRHNHITQPLSFFHFSTPSHCESIEDSLTVPTHAEKVNTHQNYSHHGYLGKLTVPTHVETVNAREN